MIGGKALNLENVQFDYGQMRMNFELKIGPSERIAIMGPSGAGKSTLLDLIAGFANPSAGRILIDGADIGDLTPGKRPISMIFQDNNLFGHLSINDNIGLGCSPSLKLSKGDHHAIESALERVGLAGKAKRKPAQLSGGERQRAALARVLVRKRPILLLDEPFASLGPALRREMITLLKELHYENAMTIIFVTHHSEDALLFSEKTAFIESGKISAFDKTDQLFGPNAPKIIQDYLGNQTKN